MNKREVMVSKMMNEAFADDWYTDFATTHPDYFQYQLNVLSCYTHINWNERYQNFLDGTTNFIDEYAFFRKRCEIMENVAIAATEVNRVAQAGMSLQTRPRISIKKKMNDEKEYASIFLRDSLFYGIKRFIPGAISGEYDCWEKYVSQYTHDKHLIESDALRNVFLDHISWPSCSVEEAFMDYVAGEIEERIPSIAGKTIMYYGREILIPLGDFGFGLSALEDAVREIGGVPAEEFQISTFRLRLIEGRHADWWIREVYKGADAKPEIEHVDTEYILQVLKYWHCDRVESRDLVYENCYGELSNFLKPMENPFTY